MSGEIVTDTQMQFNKGIKMIISAYETQTEFMNNEITKLNIKIKEKDIQCNKLEELCEKLLHDNNSFEVKLTESQNYIVKLKERISELLKENNELMNIKASIHNTIEKNKNQDNVNNYNKKEYESKLYDRPNNEKEFMNTINTNKPYPRSTNTSMENIFIEFNNKNKGKGLNIKKRNRNLSSFRKNIATCGCEHRKRTFSQRREQFNYCQSEGKIYKQIGYYSGNKGDCDFFTKCRKVLNKNEYAKLIEIVHLFNNNSIEKDVMYKKIKGMLSEGNYTELIYDFDKLFIQGNEQ